MILQMIFRLTVFGGEDLLRLLALQGDTEYKSIHYIINWVIQQNERMFFPSTRDIFFGFELLQKNH